MEGQVTLSLKEYTDLIIENHNLKSLVAQYQRKIEDDVENEIYDVRITAIQNMEEVEKMLNSSDGELLQRFTNNYTWTWMGISNKNYNVKTEKEVKEMAVSLIKRQLNCRLNDLVEEKNDN